MEDKILCEIINILRGKLKDRSNITFDKNTILSELNINSIVFIEIVVALEKVFKFEFDDEKLLSTAFPTVSSIAEYVESKI